MKKLTACFFVVAGILMATAVNAQNKVGYIDVAALITSMPEYKKADTTMGDYQNALNEQYAEMVRKFNSMDSVLSGPDSMKLTAAQRDVRKKEMAQLYVKLQGWQREAQELYNKREQDLLAPIQAKATKAIQDVAKESGYGYVFSRQTLVIDPPTGDDLLPLVKKKLGIK